MAQYAMRPLCKCGHVDWTHNTSAGGPHGSCANPHCSCSKFRPRQRRKPKEV